VTALSKIDVNQFYGIEIEEFSALIAETAMWMTASTKKKSRRPSAQ
jgi:hypothetical protein